MKQGRERSLRNRHPWIFSGAVAELPSFEDGELLPVVAADDSPLALAYFNSRSSIIGRVLSFDPAVVQSPPPVETILEQHLSRAIALRASTVPPHTSAYRLVNGESDQLPGLIVDRYDQVLVVQIGTLGMARLKPHLVSLLRSLTGARSIYERSNLPSRREEGLATEQGLLYGEEVGEVHFTEHGLQFCTNIPEAQKTGFFLDQREMRALVKQYASGRRVLNCFAYSGAFSVYAAAGGARETTSVDISATACALAEQNLALNGFHRPAHRVEVADVFDYLRSMSTPFDFIVLDPPAFAKQRPHVPQACRGYREINRVALSHLSAGGLLLTCSCSYHVDEELFQKTVFEAARDAGRFVRIIQRHRLAPDHPVSIYHPESAYLKSLLLYVE